MDVGWNNKNYKRRELMPLGEPVDVGNILSAFLPGIAS